ncbi:hypothetical protein niasHS_008372 [Heterodera schachtii]|uniref:Uncharacterized protein n=1 Tax=Heterodera schachtii TaxID=97005 RepID=A0ABD2J851_HETSC
MVSAARPYAANIAAEIGKEGLETGARFLNEVSKGGNIKDALVSEGTEGAKKLLDKASSSLQKGRGRKKRRGGRKKAEIILKPSDVVGQTVPQKALLKKKRFDSLGGKCGAGLLHHTPNELCSVQLQLQGIHPITSYVDLSKVFVCTEFKLKKVADDGVVVDVPANAAVGLIQMPGATFIRNLKVHINQREVYDSNQLYSYKVFLDNELSYPVAAKEAYFGVAGYFRDSDPTKVNDKRKKAVEESKSFQTISKLSADIFNQDLYMISNVEIDIELALQADDFMIHQETANIDKYTQELVDCILIVKTVDLMDGLSLDIAKKLDMDPARYGIQKTLMKSLFITCGIYGTKKCSGKDIELTASGRTYPQFPYNLDYKNNRYARAYHDTQEHLGMACTTESNGISYSMFKTAYCLYVFQMTNAQEDSPGFELIKEGCTAVNIRMSGENFSSDFVQMPSSDAVHDGIVLYFPDVIEKSPINFFLCLITCLGQQAQRLRDFTCF